MQGLGDEGLGERERERQRSLCCASKSTSIPLGSQSRADLLHAPCLRSFLFTPIMDARTQASAMSWIPARAPSQRCALPRSMQSCLRLPTRLGNCGSAALDLGVRWTYRRWVPMKKVKNARGGFHHKRRCGRTGFLGACNAPIRCGDFWTGANRKREVECCVHVHPWPQPSTCQHAMSRV